LTVHTEFLADLSDRLRSIADPVEAALTAAKLLGIRLAVSRAGYGLIDEAEEVVTVRRDWTSGEVASLAGEARILDASAPRSSRNSELGAS
jgi:hypothetical protein